MSERSRTDQTDEEPSVGENTSKDLKETRRVLHTVDGVQ